MANPVLHASGTQTAVIGTEHALNEPAVAGTFILEVDAVNMADGDVLELRVYSKILTGDTAGVAFFQAYYGAQLADDVIKISVPIGNDLVEATALRFTLKQTFGTGRAYKWKVLKYT